MGSEQEIMDGVDRFANSIESLVGTFLNAIFSLLAMLFFDISGLMGNISLTD